MVEGSSLRCRLCCYVGSDLRFTSCGCTLHARCMPVSLILPGTSSEDGRDNNEARPSSVLCPCCQTAPVSGFQLFPLAFELLDRASNIKATTNIQMPVTARESGTATLSKTETKISYRMGRWTEDETKFVNFLVHAFDNGSLPMANGVRLHEFLCMMLLSKTSRLTKKMRNARLSMKTYELKISPIPELDCIMLSTLQEKFLRSIHDEATKLELRFAMEKAWRQMLYNFCLQVGYATMDATAYLSYRNGSSVLLDCGAEDQSEPSFPGKVYPSLKSNSSKNFFPSSDCEESKSNKSNVVKTDSEHHEDHSEDVSNGVRTDISNCKTALMEIKNIGSIIVNEVMIYMETHHLPFEHIDVWIPSASPSSKILLEKDVTLVHAGYATRRDLHPTLFSQLQDYGGYSSQFSVAPGNGLPGRVFANKAPLWMCKLDTTEASLFERAMGATAYGIKTGVGLPLSWGNDSAFTVVIVMYSIFNLREDLTNLQKWQTDLAMLLEHQPSILEDNFEFEVENIIASTSMDPLYPKQHFPCTRPMHEQFPSFLSRSTSSFSTSMNVARREELQIASLLRQYGDMDDELTSAKAFLHNKHTGVSSWDYHQPQANGDVGAAKNENTMISLGSQVSRLRLKLLCKPEHRSRKESVLIEYLRQSYQAYLSRGLRNKSELVHLLVKEWNVWNEHNCHHHYYSHHTQDLEPLPAFPYS